MVQKYQQQLGGFCDKEFEQFLINCESKYTTAELYKIYKPLRWKLRIEFWKNKFLLIALILLFGLAVNYISFLNWNVAAIGRIAMIQMLGLWDWTKLYNEKCLIRWKPPDANVISRRESKLFLEDCVVCENYGKFLKCLCFFNIARVELIKRSNENHSYKSNKILLI